MASGFTLGKWGFKIIHYIETKTDVRRFEVETGRGEMLLSIHPVTYHTGFCGETISITSPKYIFNICLLSSFLKTPDAITHKPSL